MLARSASAAQTAPRGQLPSVLIAQALMEPGMMVSQPVYLAVTGYKWSSIYYTHTMLKKARALPALFYVQNIRCKLIKVIT